MKKTVVVVLITILFFSNVTFADDKGLEEGLSAVLIGDYDTGEIMYQYNIDETIEIASLTKLMTYTLAMDIIASSDFSLEDMVTIGREPTRVGGSTFYLREGEKVRLQILLDAILIASGNDACVAIAEHLMGSEEEFVKLMNEKANEIGLKSANFINSSGMPKWIEGKKTQNLMNIRDMFALSRYVIKNHPEILEITDRLDIDIPERKYFKENTNPLLKDIDEVDGLKTGYTDKAGYCLISTLEIAQNNNNDKNFRIISIAMGAESEAARKEKSKELLEYVISNYKKEYIVEKGELITNINVNNAKKQEVNVYAKSGLVKLINNKDKIETKISINKDLVAPMTKGEVVGKIHVYINDKKVEEVDLVITREVEETNFIMKFLRSLQNLLIKINLQDILVKWKLK